MSHISTDAQPARLTPGGTGLHTRRQRLARVAALAGLLLSTSGVGASERPLQKSEDLFSDSDVQRRGLAHHDERLWAYGVIPIWIDSTLSPTTVTAARLAMDVWNQVAGVTLVEVEGEAPPAFDHVHLQPGDGCASWVGRRGGAQALWVSPECNSGTLIHELGHVIGLEHEHTRSDRDAWIRINRENVRPDKLHNFDVAPDGSRMLGEYDYASIMHYGPDYFSIDGAATIEPLQPGVVIGQRVTPSDGDIEAVSELYGTDLAVDAKLYRSALPQALSGVHEIDVIVSNDGRNGSHGIELDLHLPGGWSIVPRATSLDEWSCSPVAQAKVAQASDVSLRCELDKLSAGVRSSLGLAVTHSGAEGSTLELSGSLNAAPLALVLHSKTDDTHWFNNQALITELDQISDGVSDGVSGSPELTMGGGSSADEPGGYINRYSHAEPEKDNPANAVLQDAVSTGVVLTGGGSAVNPAWSLLALMLLMRRRRRS